ncbi:hypothetical protein ACP70R_002809 [Stipagrostis hirtigluma subsp. patula]
MEDDDVSYEAEGMDEAVAAMLLAPTAGSSVRVRSLGVLEAAAIVEAAPIAQGIRLINVNNLQNVARAVTVLDALRLHVLPAAPCSDTLPHRFLGLCFDDDEFDKTMEAVLVLFQNLLRRYAAGAGGAFSERVIEIVDHLDVLMGMLSDPAASLEASVQTLCDAIKEITEGNFAIGSDE